MSRDLLLTMVIGEWAQYRGSLGVSGARNQEDIHRRMPNETLTCLETVRTEGIDHLRLVDVLLCIL